ncbi:hypothetical protein A3C98_04630 [Candidatus Roizmanbacteria bacterium RIFCSPHIGHO2_02_FULL_37_15]|uniref:Prepilin type IV endopeptidase peptidase domain-containing protein n=1 Tax=Candidatus Roizmanbacteria bacterium RIFCSPLOWO2_01_FULL_37_16 TaxID=1802058 RepID=A0A1F7IM86_9BACT|nr:MAG: hypothetical protein A2859_01855 [Candidatus Roizmanbacteria bacterium RIFCSPHIGHO2_01_FULL_37_16b]OGK22328.1 MAG: hypothetical protein A3C98_04630 [Candidatus Roizmanbacteria bacterium RIFCSPHIGHO2_02_FULL_37_15]OGK32961.1 MAG: hypothetical protein A3F57_03990 [Candidatus Roizmanbacteria bacterium RIFCSPHIGHO2_12_FULL_36_11]OGK44494.1 MAG: hypothetical protein A3B40_01760 [Candidatus Roizmanbacteria bacterium RIFCSPLOWO2_01_FULL_37_16]OGK57608.1 MAG: hypothetical protein A3I50_05535 [C
MDLLTYSIISIVLILILHFGVGIKDDFNLFVTAGIFVIGAAMGAYLKSYEFGLGAAIILTLVMW